MLNLKLCSDKMSSRLIGCDSNSVISMNELSNQDEIEFCLHDCDDSPGILLKKNGHVVWTLIAARTRSRLRVYLKDNYINSFYYLTSYVLAAVPIMVCSPIIIIVLAMRIIVVKLRILSERAKHFPAKLANEVICSYVQ